MVLLHTVVSGRSRRIVQILQEQSTGIVAEHSEAQNKAPRIARRKRRGLLIGFAGHV